MITSKTDENLNSNYLRAIHILKSKGYKLTPIRKKILNFLIQNHGPFTHEELQNKIKNIDPVTLYRNLTHFQETSIIRKINFNDGVSRYEFNHEDHHHHHVICRSCHKIQVIHDCVLDQIDLKIKKMGFREITHHLEFFGKCSQC